MVLIRRDVVAWVLLAGGIRSHGVGVTDQGPQCDQVL